MKPPKKLPSIGRPSIPAEKKATKPNISLDPALQDEARHQAGKIGIGYSAFVARAIIREIGRCEALDEIKAKDSAS